MNLAPLKYGKILRKDGGPLDRISVSSITHNGQGYYQANSYLSAHLNIRQNPLFVFGESSGTGTHTSRMVATHMAISESLERWAYYFLNQIGHRRTYGFDREPSTIGMAAYPGLFPEQARKRAKREAIEHYCLSNTYRGGLRCIHLNTDPHKGTVTRLENPISKDTVILAWRTSEDGLTAHGSACEGNMAKAIEKAQIEMERSMFALHHFFKRNRGIQQRSLSRIQDKQEMRIVKMALQGEKTTFQKLLQNPPLSVRPPAPKMVIDRMIPGPWQKYASVWRVLYAD
jgi:ribosomal protein L9